MRGCSDQVQQARAERAEANTAVDANGGAVVNRRPQGCPQAFCGCEASLYLFGEIRPELNLASNWVRKFPRTSPAPGMAAARSGHVMVLMSHVEGNNWLVHDGNSGGGLTREHVRSIKGYVIVNPRGAFAENPPSGMAVRSAAPQQCCFPPIASVGLGSVYGLKGVRLGPSSSDMQRANESRSLGGGVIS
jgi:hypothetical protein